MEKTGMTQNDKDLEVIDIVQDNYHKKRNHYSINRLKSKKFVRAKHLKINPRLCVTILLAAGVLTIASMSLANNISGNQEVVTAETQIEQSEEEVEIPNETDAESTEVVEEVVQEEKEESIEEKLLKKYCCEVYGLKYDVAYNIASKLTDNFTSEEYLTTLNPGYSVDKKQAFNKEHGFILFARHLFQKPQDFGLSKDDVVDYDFVSKGQGNEEYKVKYYSDIFKVDKELVLAIEYQESSSGAPYQSKAYLENNNPAGLMNPSNPNLIWTFQSPDAGIIEHIYQLKTYYLDLGFTTPEQIREKYAPSDASNDSYNLNQYWVDGVNTFLKKIQNNPNVFDNKDQSEDKKQVL